MNDPHGLIGLFALPLGLFSLGRTLARGTNKTQLRLYFLWIGTVVIGTVLIAIMDPSHESLPWLIPTGMLSIVFFLVAFAIYKLRARKRKPDPNAE